MEVENSEEAVTQPNDSTVINSNVVEKPPVATVHATAFIENSPNVNFCQDELDSVIRFITNKEHLVKNVANITYCESSTRKQENGLFSHMVRLELLVKTESLWESPRSYLWKHVGQDQWERGNGSVITLKRIHQK